MSVDPWLAGAEARLQEIRDNHELVVDGVEGPHLRAWNRMICGHIQEEWLPLGEGAEVDAFKPCRACAGKRPVRLHPFEPLPGTPPASLQLRREEDGEYLTLWHQHACGHTVPYEVPLNYPTIGTDVTAPCWQCDPARAVADSDFHDPFAEEGEAPP